MSDYETIKLDIEDNVATLTINRPERFNAMPTDMADEIRNVIDRQPDLGYRALVITGEGKAFCSGADLALKKGPTAITGGASSRASLRQGYNPLIIALRESSVPIVSAVNGPCAGVGVGVALSADFVFASENAYFLQAFVNIGLVPDGGSSWVLPRMVGIQRAKEMMMLGERISAEQAAEWGMIYKAVSADSLLEDAQAMAKRLANGPTVALGLMRKMVNDNLNTSLVEALNTEAEAQFQAGNSEDSKEGITAFLQKRKAEFKGK